jgi:hypothetical protein
MTGAFGRPGRVPREAVSILVAVGQVAGQRGSMQIVAWVANREQWTRLAKGGSDDLSS